MPVRMMMLVSQLHCASNQAAPFTEGVMAGKVTARMLADDREALVGIKTLDDYRPANEAFSVERLEWLDERLTRVSEERVRLWKSYEAITAEENGLKQEFHDGVTGARRSVKAQYPGNAHAIQAAGMKRTMDYKRRKRRVSAEKATPAKE
jgi:hypothetical protein